MELWDAYDREFHRIENVTLVRGEKVPEGMYHLVSEVIVRHVDGTYLLMQRDFRKHLGGKWELTAGGSALQGETEAECAWRELQEETGISTGKMEEIGRIIHEGHRTAYVEYLCVTDFQKDAIVLQEGETIQFKWVTKEELTGMDQAELASPRSMIFLSELQK